MVGLLSWNLKPQIRLGSGIILGDISKVPSLSNLYSCFFQLSNMWTGRTISDLDMLK